jgi:MFS family permease
MRPSGEDDSSGASPEDPRRPAVESRLPRGLAPLASPQFRWLYASNIAFFFAMGSQGVVRAWLAFKLTESEFALGLVMFAVAVPMLFVAPIGGALADRRERRSVIALGQFLVASSELVILALIVTDSLAFWHLLSAAALMGCVFPFIMPARQAIVVTIVGKQGLGQAVALNMAGMNATRVLGPALAGFLISILGVDGTYVIGVGLYVIGLLCVLRVRRSHPPADARDRSVYSSILDGASYVRDNNLVLVLLLFGLIPMFLAMPFQNLLVVFADEIWKVGSEGLGILSATAGLGGVVGSIWVSFLASSRRRLRNMMWSMMLFGSLLFGFALSPWYLLGIGLVFAANIFASIFGTLNNAAIQIVIPDEVRGRVSSFLMMSFSLPLLGTLPMAAVAEVWGAPFAVALAAVLALSAAIAFYAASAVLRSMDQRVRAALEEDAGTGGHPSAMATMRR